MTTIHVSTWGRFGTHERLGDIRVKMPPEACFPSDKARVVAASIARRLGLSVCGGPRSDGTSLDNRGNPESHHYAVTLGRPVRSGGYSPEAEVWFAIPATAKNPAAVALGRLAGSVRSERKAAAVRRNGALGGRPRLLADIKYDWSRERIWSTQRGYIVQIDSQIQGTRDGQRYALDYSPAFPQGLDMNGQWNEGTSNAQAVIHQAREAGRCLAHGRLVQ